MVTLHKQWQLTTQTDESVRKSFPFCFQMLSTGCPKSHAPSLTRYIFRYENSIAIKEVCLDRVTLYNFVDTKHDLIDYLVTYLSKLKWISSKYTKIYLKDP